MRLHPQPRRSANSFANLLRIAERGLPLTAGNGQAFFRIAIASSGGFLVFPLRSLAFRDWFFANYFGDYNTLPTNAEFRATLHHLEAQANANPANQRLAVYHRIGARGPGPIPSQILLNLADEECRFVEISPGSWKVTAGENALFETCRASAELPSPTLPADPAASFESLRQCLNLPDRTTWLRLLSWLVSTLRPFGPYSFLVLQGPPGAGKSTLAHLLRFLVDPVAAALSPIAHNPRQLFALARHQWILVFDQISTLSPALSDALCRLATNGGAIVPEVAPSDPTRDLLMRAYRRPILFTVTGRWSPSPEFARRSITIHLPAIPAGNLQSQTAILTRFHAAYPQWIGALCSAVATALERISQIQLSGTIHHPDTLAWALAAAPALGCTESEIQQALATPDPPPAIVQALDTLLAPTGHWTGTPTALFKLLPPGLFANPRALSATLNSSVDVFTAAGIELKSNFEHGGRKVLHLRRLDGGANLVQASDFAPPGLNASPQPSKKKRPKAA